MKKFMIERELVAVDYEAENQEDFFEKMADKLYKSGYVKNTYTAALKKREEDYPTGLPVEPYPVAIPHADIQHIIKPFIAAVRLKNPLEWHEMGNEETVLSVKFIFLLGFLKADEHIELLQLLVDGFQNPSLMEQLLGARTEDEYYETACGILGM